jgi:uncharacterized membrane protein required for colicin V production
MAIATGAVLHSHILGLMIGILLTIMLAFVLFSSDRLTHEQQQQWYVQN